MADNRLIKTDEENASLHVSQNRISAAISAAVDPLWSNPELAIEEVVPSSFPFLANIFCLSGLVLTLILAA
jgi:hypothetical protein